MTVSAQSAISIFLGDGLNSTFTFPWSGVSASDINVYTVIDGTQTLLLNTQYTLVLNAASAGQLWGVGGTVTYPIMGTPLANGTMLVIERAVPYSQNTNVANQTAYPLSVQTALDVLCFELQQIVSRTGQQRGTWASNVQYNFGDIVQDGANGSNTLNLYMSTGVNTSTTWATDLAAGEWSLVFNVQNLNNSIGNFLPIAGGTITGSLVVNTNLSVGGTLTVTGNATFSGDLTATGGTVRVPTLGAAENSTKAASTAMVQAAIAASVVTSLPITPQGRLTLVSNTPVMVSDQSAKTAIYYDPYLGSSAPVWDGAKFVNTTFTQLTLTLNTSNHLSTNLYDVFVFSNVGVLTLGTGPAWTNSTTRSAAITLSQSIWTNSGVITLINDATTFSNVPANKATYLGTFYATANGQTGMVRYPAATNGGNANILGLYNAYNRIQVGASSSDNSSAWTYSTNTVRAANNSTSNRISWVDGLQQSSITARYYCCISTASASNGGQIGIGINSTTAFATASAEAIAALGANSTASVTSEHNAYPLLGFNYAQALENCPFFSASTMQFNNGTNMYLTLSLAM